MELRDVSFPYKLARRPAPCSQIKISTGEAAPLPTEIVGLSDVFYQQDRTGEKTVALMAGRAVSGKSHHLLICSCGFLRFPPFSLGWSTPRRTAPDPPSIFARTQQACPRRHFFAFGVAGNVFLFFNDSILEQHSAPAMVRPKHGTVRGSSRKGGPTAPTVSTQQACPMA